MVAGGSRKKSAVPSRCILSDSALAQAILQKQAADAMKKIQDFFRETVFEKEPKNTRQKYESETAEVLAN